MKYQLILASKSPRRKELLGWLDVPFDILVSDADEDSVKAPTLLLAQEIAQLKGKDIFSKLDREKFPAPLIVAADTVVTLNGKFYGKPVDRADAKRILLELSGHTHQVITGVYLKAFDKEPYMFSSISDVTFDAISDDILEHYLDTKESMDKAGAYGIQGAGLMFISKLSGSYSNVVGFPLSEFISHLKIYLDLKDDLKHYF